jgi:hypothetical protein
MRKLLLVMLVPVLVLGVMGCGSKIDESIQTDAYIQGAWLGSGDASGFTLVFNAGQMTVTTDKTVTPYRTEFSYISADPRFISADVGEDAWAGEADVTFTSSTDQIVASVVLFKYEDNTELMTVYLFADVTNKTASGCTMTVAKVVYAEDYYYFKDAIPEEGTYTKL